MGSPSHMLILFVLYENRGEKPLPRLMPSKNLPTPHQPDTDCCTEFLHMPRGEMAPHGSCRFNGRILLANPLQSSKSTFSRGRFLSFFAFKEGMLGTPISELGG